MKPRIRAPFVVTIVVASMSSACGSSNEAPDATTESDGGRHDGESIDVAEASLFDADDTRDSSMVNPAECPTSDPGIGDIHKPCTAGTTVRCVYEDLCPQHPIDQTQNVYACHDDGTGDHWTLVSKDYVPSCPDAEPTTGDPCPCTIHMAFVACNYGSCEDFTRTYAACKGVDTFDLAWKVSPITCNPPEVDGGDADVGDSTDGD